MTRRVVGVDFRLLGGIEAFRDGEPIDVGHARQQCVLTALLVDANTLVTVDQLIDRIWGEHASPRASGTLHTYIARLRRCLAPTEILHRSGAYRLCVDAAAVDLHRFRHLIARAHASDDQKALDLFAEALGLWRGEAFGSLDTPWVNGIRATLAIERSAAELDYIDQQLHSGRHTHLLADLTARTAQKPLDERVAGQLMLALYRSGRQADALQHYRQIRRCLAEELGTDPGPALQRLHRQILSADSELAIPVRSAHARAVSEAAEPRQLPAMPRLFAGRERELAALTETMADHPGTAVISAIGGAGGIGKTWLALYWAHRNTHRFPDGQLFVNLRGFDPTSSPMEPTTAVRGFLDALGVEPGKIPQDLDGRTALYRSLIADKRMVVLLDNAIDTAQVTPLLPGSSESTVIITSRNAMPALIAGYGARPVVLDVLADPQANQLLTHHLGRDRLAAEPDAVTDLLRHCAGLPLALGITAARAASHPTMLLADLAAEVREAVTRLDALDSGELPVGLRAVFSWSYRALPPDAARAFGLLGLAPGADIGLAAAANLTGLRQQQARTLLRQLETASLLYEPEPGRYRMHDLLRLYATEQAHSEQSAAVRHAALRRLVEFYLHTAHAANQSMDPRQPPIQLVRPADCMIHVPESEAAALAWLETERANLLAVASYAADHGLATHAGQLSPILWRFLDTRGHHDSALTLHTRALAADRVTGNHALAGHTLIVLGLLHWRSGRYEQAFEAYQEGLSLCRAEGLRRLEGHALHGCGLTGVLLGRFSQALGHFQQALEVADEIGVGELEADARHGLAMIHRRQGRYEAALDQLRRAELLARDAGISDLYGRVIHAIGTVYEQQGRFDEALPHLRTALEIAHGGARHLECYALCGLGATYRGMGRFEEAGIHLHEALDIARETGSRHNEAEALIGLGQLALATGEPEHAIPHYRDALTLADRAGARDQQAHAHNGIADAARVLGDHPAVRHHRQQARRIFTDLGVPEAAERRIGAT
ncbi:tetratricopeptide repeat protein [Nocardia sp. NPDC051321]|uniref:AfsR/SARP family transcriptional regulator n=1 Tax=Nocardia sp. NPDC051321 TaxID=3364323 RepID=UPI0037A07617